MTTVNIRTCPHCGHLQLRLRRWADTWIHTAAGRGCPGPQPIEPKGTPRA